jgi:hypothetical protein
MTTLEERAASMPRLVQPRLAAACALALILLLVTASPAAAKGTRAELRVVNGGGKTLAEETLQTGTTTIPTSRKATCLGKGTGGSGKGVKVKGPTALGLLGQAAKSTPALQPLRVTDHFLGEFGLGLCGIGGFNAQGGKSWYLKVNHRNPELGGDSVKLKAGDEVLWALASYPYPSELSLVAPTEATAGVPFEVQVFYYDDRGKRKPAQGVTVSGAAAPTDSTGRTSVVLTGPGTLAATHGKDIPSNRVAVCVGGACPAG